MEAGWGHTSRGKFRGFRLDAAVNQLGLPLRAIVMPGNRYDSPFLPKLILDLEADYVLADAGYDSKQTTEPSRTLMLSQLLLLTLDEGNARRSRMPSS